jgi:uracil-DNA glycosylase
MWHQRLTAHMPDIELTLLAGQYAQAYYLGRRRRHSLTATVAAWQDYLPDYLPLPHPSWRNTAWLRKNPWFEAELLPVLRKRTAALLA